MNDEVTYTCPHCGRQFDGDDLRLEQNNQGWYICPVDATVLECSDEQ